MATKTERLRYNTYKDLMFLLNNCRECCMIRPTGFGKTGILTRLIKEHGINKGGDKRFKHILYLYPTDKCRDAVLDFYYGRDRDTEKQNSIPGLTFMSYKKVGQIMDDEVAALHDVDLMISDECHRLGATYTQIGVSKLLEANPNMQHIGATATPERSDGYDVIRIFFHNHITYRYDQHNAIQDGVLKKPVYLYCTYNVNRILSDVEKKYYKETERLGLDKTTVDLTSQSFKKKLIQISKICAMDSVIKNVCDIHAQDLNYMKFIIFFAGYEHIGAQRKQVIQWFKDAYPEHTVSAIEITGRNYDTLANVKQLSKLKHKDKHIDLIFTVNMLNMGYHVGDLTGILMYRGTNSSIIYNQQLGRVMDSGCDKTKIVIDCVDNLHRKSLYEVLGQKSFKTIQDKERFAELQRKNVLHEANPEKNPPLSIEEEKEYKALKTRFVRKDGGFNHGFTTSDIMAEDITVHSHEATLRDLIRKTVAEPLSVVCRQAYAQWKEYGGDDSSGTAEGVIKDNILCPLPIFADIKNISTESILEEIFGEGNYSELLDWYYKNYRRDEDRYHYRREIEEESNELIKSYANTSVKDVKRGFFNEEDIDD